MRRFIIIIVFIQLFAYLAISCSDIGEASLTPLSVTGIDDSLSIGGNNSTRGFYIGNGLKWRIKLDDSVNVRNWLSISPMSGDGYDSVYIRAKQFPRFEEEMRNANLTLYIGDLTRPIHVEQTSIIPKIEIKSKTIPLYFGEDGGTDTIQIKSNVEWDAKASGLTLNCESGSAGSDYQEIIVSCKKYANIENFDKSIRIVPNYYNGDIDTNWIITAKQSYIFISVYDKRNDTIRLGANPDILNQQIKVKCNTNWYSSLIYKDKLKNWLKYEEVEMYGDQTRDLTCLQRNDGETPRAATILFITNNDTATVEVEQAPSYILNFNGETSIDLSKKKDFTIKSNVAWKLRNPRRDLFDINIMLDNIEKTLNKNGKNDYYTDFFGEGGAYARIVIDDNRVLDNEVELYLECTDGNLPSENSIKLKILKSQN